MRRTRLPYVAALDGIRALSIAAVLVYHADARALPGGFVGVEVFFVLSGYLITSLLLAEWHGTGTIALRAFWSARARRLLPAAFATMVGSLAAALVLAPDDVTRLRRDAIFAAAYVANWQSIFADESYFESFGRPPLLRHFWSLAIEEQFYLLWPLLLGMGLARAPRALAPAIGLLATASFTLGTVLFVAGHDPSRVYYGTDTRAAGLLWGALLAFVPAAAAGAARWPRCRWADLGGAGAMGVLAWLAFTVSEPESLWFRGGLLMADAATAFLVLAALRGPATSVILSAPVLRWLGTRSYSLYLWHWPVLMFTRPGADVPFDGAMLLALRLAISLTLAELSYRAIEQPVRRDALGRAWTALCTKRQWKPRAPRLVAGVTLATTSAGVLAACVASAQPAGRPAYLPADEVYLDGWTRRTPETLTAPVSTGTPLPPPTVAEAAFGGAVLAASTDRAELPAPQPTFTSVEAAPTPVQPAPESVEAPRDEALPGPPPAPVAASRVFAIGDSVMLGAAGQLSARIPSLALDARVSRQASEALQILTQRAAAGQLGDAVVIHIGNNGEFSQSQLLDLMSVVAAVPRVVFVTLRVPRDWEGANNQVLASASHYPNVVIVDWHGLTEGRWELFWDDGIHLRPEGAQFYAELIAAALQ